MKAYKTYIQQLAQITHPERVTDCACSWASQVVLVVKNPPANAGDLRDVGSTPGLGRSPGGRHGNPLQYSCLENPTDGGAWRATVHRVSKSRTQLRQLSTHVLVATVTNGHRLDGLGQHRFVTISFRMGSMSRCPQALLLLDAPRENPSRVLYGLRRLPALLGSGRHHSDLRSRSHMTSSVSGSPL